VKGSPAVAGGVASLALSLRDACLAGELLEGACRAWVSSSQVFGGAIHGEAHSPERLPRGAARDLHEARPTSTARVAPDVSEATRTMRSFPLRALLALVSIIPIVNSSAGCPSPMPAFESGNLGGAPAYWSGVPPCSVRPLSAAGAGDD